MHSSSESTDPRAGRGQRGLFPWTLLAGILLLAALAAPCLVGCIYTYDDLGAFHLPVRAFYARQLARGEPFDWMPQLCAGFYLTGEGQAGTYHPLHLVLYRCLPLQAAWGCELLASYPFMLAGTYFFLRRHLRRRDAAMFGSLVFTFSGFNLLHFVHTNAIAIAAHVPWLLWMIHVVLVDADRRRVVAAQAGIAVLTASQVLLGYPQYVWFSLLTEVAYGAFILAGRSERGGAPAELDRPSPVDRTADTRRAAGRKRAGNRCWHWVIAKGAGVMLGGIQLLPTLDALDHSVRRSPDAAFLDVGSLHPSNLIQLVAPYLFTIRVVGCNTHALGLYAGAVPLMLAVWLWVCRRQLGRLRLFAFWAAAFGLFALLLAFGKYAPLYHWQHALPLANKFRFPCRYILLFHLSAAVVSAIALVILARQHERKEKTPWRRLTALWAIGGLSALVAMIGFCFQHHPSVAPWPAVLGGPLLIGSAAVLVAMAARGVRWSFVALVLFAAADLGYYGMSYATYPHMEPLEAFVARVDKPPTALPGRVLGDVPRLNGSGMWTGGQMTLAGWHQVDGYVGLEPARRLDYRQVAALRVAGTRWVRNSEAAAVIEGLRPFDERWLQVPEPLRRIRLVTRAEPSHDPARDITRIPLETTALVEHPLALPPGSSGTATPIEDQPGRLCVHVDCPTTQLLVVADSYHPGWQAELDGRPQTVLRVNGDFLGCVIPPGTHDVLLRFRPRSLRDGMLLSSLGLVLVGGLALGGLAGTGSRGGIDRSLAAPADHVRKNSFTVEKPKRASSEREPACDGSPPATAAELPADASALSTGDCISGAGSEPAARFLEPDEPIVLD